MVSFLATSSAHRRFRRAARRRLLYLSESLRCPSSITLLTGAVGCRPNGHAGIVPTVVVANPWAHAVAIFAASETYFVARLIIFQMFALCFEDRCDSCTRVNSAILLQSPAISSRRIGSYDSICSGSPSDGSVRKARSVPLYGARILTGWNQFSPHFETGVLMDSVSVRTRGTILASVIIYPSRLRPHSGGGMWCYVDICGDEV